MKKILLIMSLALVAFASCDKHNDTTGDIPAIVAPSLVGTWNFDNVVVNLPENATELEKAVAIELSIALTQEFLSDTVNIVFTDTTFVTPVFKTDDTGGPLYNYAYIDTEKRIEFYDVKTPEKFRSLDVELSDTLLILTDEYALSYTFIPKKD